MVEATEITVLVEVTSADSCVASARSLHPLIVILLDPLYIPWFGR